MVSCIITYLTVPLVLRPFRDDPINRINKLIMHYLYMDGGIEGVIWTDVISRFITFGGAVLIFIMICFKVDGGISEILPLQHKQINFPTNNGAGVGQIALFLY